MRTARSGHVVLREARLGRSDPRLRLLLCGTRFVESLFRRSPRAGQPLGTLTIARRKGERGLRVRPRSLQLRKIAGHGGRREQPRELLPSGHARPQRHVEDARQAAVNRSRDVSGAAGSGLQASRDTNRLAHGLLTNEGSPEVQAPLLLLEKTNAWRLLAGLGCCRASGFGIGVHIDLTHAMLVVAVPRHAAR